MDLVLMHEILYSYIRFFFFSGPGEILNFGGDFVFFNFQIIIFRKKTILRQKNIPSTQQIS